MLKAIVFDFDGVLVDTYQLKIEAFRQLFADRDPAAVDQLVRYHIVHGGISRYEKFDFFFKEVLGEPLPAQQRAALGQRFSELVVDGVVAAPYVEGAREFLQAHHRRLDLFVASGTPEEELKAIVKARGMDRFFKGVRGSPARKAVIVTRLMVEQGYDAAEVVLVGDSITDQEGAQGAGVRFIGRVAPGEEDPFQEHPDHVATLPDLTGLARVLETLDELDELDSLNGDGIET